MKRINKISIFICVFFIMVAPVFASENFIPVERQLPRLVDDANLLSDYEAETLLERLDEISVQEQVDVAVVTVNGLDGKTSKDYADDFYDYNGYGMGDNDDGILLLVSMADRDLAITTHGSAITIFSDYTLEYIIDQFIEDLGAGNYSRAFNTFADLCLDYIVSSKTIYDEPEPAVPDTPRDYADGYYDYEDVRTNDRGFFLTIRMFFDGVVYMFPSHITIVVILIGAIIAFIITGIMRSKLKSVRMQSTASNYVINNSLNITDSRDAFLYSSISKVKIQKQSSSSSSGGSSTHRSSSGHSHGGTSRKF